MSWGVLADGCALRHIQYILGNARQEPDGDTQTIHSPSGPNISFRSLPGFSDDQSLTLIDHQSPLWEYQPH